MQFYLLSEDGFGLSTETLLLSVVTTTALGSAAFLRLLVLRDLVHFVAVALAAVGSALFWNVDLQWRKDEKNISRLTSKCSTKIL